MKQQQKDKGAGSGSPCNTPHVPHISRTAVVRADAQHRWDYVYQLLLQWSAATEPTEPPEKLGECGELADQSGHLGHPGYLGQKAQEEEAQEAQEDSDAN